MKRDAQTFEWICEGGILIIRGRKDTPMTGIVLEYDINDYPETIRQNIADAGFKAVFQQRSSQVDSDHEKVRYWNDLDKLFQSGEWEREGGARGAPVIAAWIEAAAESKGCTPGEFQASWSKLDKATRDKIKANCEAKFAARIVAIKADRKSAVDLTDLA